ncbi:unnamed protein product [Lymnaea stagnalis]|uniref:Uncharacterized protein n=1 Tax=Lymnaea stagnalis TaxID=6523 RepID=A0AAV2I6W7_LYMST
MQSFLLKTSGPVLYLVVLHIYTAQAQKPCCWFRQWEGYIHNIYGVYDSVSNYASTSDIQSYVHVDYGLMKVVNELMVVNASVLTTVTVIGDYKKKISYTIVGRECFQSPLTDALDESCVPEDAILIGTHSFLGVKANTFILPFHNATRTTTSRITVSSDNCLPLHELLLTIDKTSSFSTITMQNVTAGIVDPSIFNVPDFCNQKPKVTQVLHMNTVGWHTIIKHKIL